jgi:hypothetical protein
MRVGVLDVKGVDKVMAPMVILKGGYEVQSVWTLTLT